MTENRVSYRPPGCTVVLPSVAHINTDGLLSTKTGGSVMVTSNRFINGPVIRDPYYQMDSIVKSWGVGVLIPQSKTFCY